MTNKDKVAIILSQYGFSLQEGAEMYDRMKAAEENFILELSAENDVMVWLETGWTNGHENDIHIMVWRNYKRDFCLNYALAGAVALMDEEINIEREDEARQYIEFFRQCQEADRHSAPMPDLPDAMRWMFRQAALTDYMETDDYEVTDETALRIKIE